MRKEGVRQPKTAKSLHPVIITIVFFFLLERLCMGFLGKTSCIKLISSWSVLKALELELGNQESSFNSMKGSNITDKLGHSFIVYCVTKANLDPGII